MSILWQFHLESNGLLLLEIFARCNNKVVLFIILVYNYIFILYAITRHGRRRHTTDLAIRREANLATFCVVAALPWNKFLIQGTKLYIDGLSYFCDTEMSQPTRCVLSRFGARVPMARAAVVGHLPGRQGPSGLCASCRGPSRISLAMASYRAAACTDLSNSPRSSPI
jgi:hypothetical protein